MNIRPVIAASVLACLAALPIAAVVDAPSVANIRPAVTVTAVCSVPTIDNGMCRSGGRFRVGSAMTPGRVTVESSFILFNTDNLFTN